MSDVFLTCCGKLSGNAILCRAHVENFCARTPWAPPAVPEAQHTV